MAAPVRKQETNNVITLAVLDGKLGVKPEVRYNKDGSVDKRHTNKVAGVSSEVYPFTEEEVQKMIEYFNRKIDEAPDDNKRQIACRNKMMFVLGINLGIRVSDLCSIKWNFFFDDDMKFKEFYKIQPKKTRKTGKFVTLYFNKAIKKAIQQYMNEYPVEDFNEYLFKSRKGNDHLTEAAIGKIIKEAAGEIGVTKNIASHSLRKSFAYHIWHNAEDKEKSLVYLMTIFNHSSVATTKKYIGIMGEEIEDVFMNLNLGLEDL